MNATRLWSLWDMLRVYAMAYINLGQRIAETKLGYYMADTDLDEPGRGPTDAEAREIKNNLSDMLNMCGELDLPVSKELISSCITNIPRTEREFDLLVAAVTAEIRDKLFFFIPANRAKYFENTPRASYSGFPRVSAELARSGNCYAVGEYTASVFHAMRAAEIALKAIATRLNVALPPETSQWQNLLDQIDNEIRKIANTPKTVKRDEDLKLYSSAAAQFRYFKDAWRNYVSHARETYDETQAVSILGHVTELIMDLTGEISEQPI